MAKKKEHNTYRHLKQQYPQYLDAVEALGAAVREAGPLEEKGSSWSSLARRRPSIPKALSTVMPGGPRKRGQRRRKSAMH